MSNNPNPSAEETTSGEAEGTRRSCLDDPAELRDRRVCLNRISKNLEGDLRPREDPVIESCGDPDCNTLKAFHMLELQAALHEECDEVRELDGTLAVPDLVHAYQSGDFTERGVHVGTFEWRGAGVIARGSLSGMTNAGTHRGPVHTLPDESECQSCNARGWMEGRFCGEVIEEGSDPALVGSQLVGTYRLRFRPSSAGGAGAVRGTLEGSLMRPCRAA